MFESRVKMNLEEYMAFIELQDQPLIHLIQVKEESKLLQ